MTYNVHQLLHLKSDVENLGPLWTHSCFFFEDLNGDFRDLFHGTQNINGQVRIIKNNKYFLEVIYLAINAGYILLVCTFSCWGPEKGVILGI